VQVEVIADVCYDFLRALNLNVQHHDRLLSLSNAVLTEHIADNQVYILSQSFILTTFLPLALCPTLCTSDCLLVCLSVCLCL